MERSSFVFIGNHFITDFVNTRKNSKGARTELLNGFDDVMLWIEQAGKRRFVSGNPESLPQAEREKLFRELLAFRNLLEHAFARIMQENAVPFSFVERLNRELTAYSGYDQLAFGPSAIERVRYYAISRLPALFLEEAANFLTALEPHNLKKCESPDCILYFYDTSRNRQRRWCSMDRCGNRAKASQHYYRKKKPLNADGGSGE